MKKIILYLVFSIFLVSFVSAANINVPTDYATIQAAINAASPGDTITINAGTYNENVVIGTKNNLIIQGQGITSIIEPATGIGFKIIDSDSITIKNLKIHTTGSNAHGIWVGGDAHLYGNSNTLTIQDNTI